MGVAYKLPYITVEEYLEGEKSTQVRHEYSDGRVFAMSGSSMRHNLITGNLFELLRVQLRGTGCSAFSTAVKVAAGPTSYYYPDVTVTCSAIEQNLYVCPEPVLLIEVLSPSTEQIDRREKLLAYQRIESLREYAIVAQDQISIEVYRRQEQGGVWEREQLIDEGELKLTSVGLLLATAEIYRDIRFD